MLIYDILFVDINTINFIAYYHLSISIFGMIFNEDVCKDIELFYSEILVYNML